MTIFIVHLLIGLGFFTYITIDDIRNNNWSGSGMALAAVTSLLWPVALAVGVYFWFKFREEEKDN